jgi:methyl-accepting chemotaxis protein
VKNFAAHTQATTQYIGSQIASTQAATREAVESIQSITTVVSDVSSIARTIAAAVQRQESATAEIAQRVLQTV